LRVRAAGEQLLGDHAVERVEVGGGDGFRRLRRGAAGEHGETRKAPLLGVSQQVVAPVDGRAQRLLACGRVAGAGAERAERAERGVQAFGDLAGERTPQRAAARREAEPIAELQQLTSWHPWLIDDTTSAVLASLSGASPRAEIYDLRADTYTVNGTTKHNNVPGLGRVTHASGSFTYSTATRPPPRPPDRAPATLPALDPSTAHNTDPRPLVEFEQQRRRSAGAQPGCEQTPASDVSDSVPGRRRPPLRNENPCARIDAGEAWCVRARATAWRGDLWDR
jgi:hypothetical protein